jgi:hypothetical protein
LKKILDLLRENPKKIVLKKRKGAQNKGLEELETEVQE